LTVPDVHGTLARRLRDGLASSLAPFAHMHPADAATNWNVVIRQRRWGFTVGQVLRQRGVAYENPFFYRPFLEFAKHLGPRSRTGGHLYLNVHQRVFERTADLPRSNDGRSPNEITDQLYARRGSIWQRVMNRLNAEVARRQASRCPGRVPVYNHRQWLMSDTLFRRRYIELLEQASAGLPAILAPEKFGAALDSLARHEVDFDPVELGRGICLALWGQKWGGAGGLP